MDKVVIIHGTKGSPNGNWFPWLSRELAMKGFKVVVPEMPTPEGQSLKNWISAFQNQVGKFDDNTTLIGHSVGALFILRLLEHLPSPIKSTVLVAGFTGAIGNPEYDLLNASFVEGEYDWESIRRNAGAALVMYGDNDPYVPISQSEEIAAGLMVKPCIVAGGGHLNSEFGYSEFPLLLTKMLQPPSQRS